MKKKLLNYIKLFIALYLFGFTVLGISQNVQEFKGQIIDKNNNTPLALADIIITNSNISTISNSDGEYLIKVPNDLLNETLIVTYLGYQKSEIPLQQLKTNPTIQLNQAATVLAQVDINKPKDAITLVKKMLELKGDNYLNQSVSMTGFYRETIKKRNRNASLSEAVVNINKQSYDNSRNDGIKLIKARKKVNYNRLDTIALKLRGGPFSSLFTDMIKYPKYIFSKSDLLEYDFTFSRPTQIDNRLVYVINFKQKKDVYRPKYTGKLYIDANTFALTSAVYNLNVENREEASKMFVRKKPNRAKVYPTEASYRVNYRTKDGKWYFGYSNIQLTFKINWDKRWFNSKYTLNSEMAITDWSIGNPLVYKKESKTLKQNSILLDEASGFSDPDFWGEYNIIEPEKSIENAIKKINKTLKQS
ncbi:carboxypeptidase-like regulatory domain-containing protein [Olleya aquimaris]|uniref:Carboxypeptidase-like regulatory domain-containing protein n=1 Tax=Olleya sediminilitoris TaxID=2795739 RepID=A0ABS1WPL1_9FLAO|nr:MULTISPECIES: carboxypeptidase-like regulatory domain-containing protein [Olleya]AXO79889.1 carboxypeptidase-like regulatory domain-containing protein [Olleya aquimaris]MBL7561040.1 carboxypeptidase-like regulatory domain-containing protein [Olleya sediminilitoris]